VAPWPLLGEGLTPPPAHGLSLGVELLQPDSRGQIRLASAEPAEAPVIDPGYLTAESDLRGLVVGLRIAGRLCDTAALRPYVGAPMAPGPARSMVRSWRRSFENMPRRHTTVGTWAATMPRWWTVSCGSAAWMGCG
jgi:choline dehydrogenase-like flavoprotein